MAYEYQSFATLGVNLNRQNYGALDISQVFTSQADLNYYISKGAITEGVSTYWYDATDAENIKKVVPYPYAGQYLALVDNATREVTAYILVEKADGTFETKEVGKAPIGDDKSIEVDAAGVISLKGFNDLTEAQDDYLPRVKWVGAEGNVAAHAEIEWVPVSTVVKGDGNKVTTLTSEDESVKITTTTSTDESLVYDLSVEHPEYTIEQYPPEEGDTYYTYYLAKDGVNISSDKDINVPTVEYVDGLRDRVSSLENGKANKATTLAGYGITDAYTKEETDNLLNGKVDNATLADYYTKAQADAKFADKAETLAGYGITDAYTKEEADKAIGDAIAVVDHLKRKIYTLEQLQADVEANKAGVDQFIYMIPADTALDQDVYDEYMVINGQIEKVGSWEVDLSDYVTTGALNTTLSGYYTKTDADNAIGNAIDSLDFEVTNTSGLIGIGLQRNGATLGESGTLGLIPGNNVELSSDKDNNITISVPDVYTKDEVDTAFNDYATKEGLEATNEEVAKKANAADVYTAEEVDGLIAPLATTEAVNKKADADKVYTKDETNNLLNAKANADAVYTKEEVDEIIGEAGTPAVKDEEGNVTSEAVPGSGIYENVYSKAEITELIEGVTGGESAAAVKAALTQYQTTNDAAVKGLGDRVGAVEEHIKDVEAGAQVNVIDTVASEFEVNGKELQLVSVPANKLSGLDPEELAITKVGEETEGKLRIVNVSATKLTDLNTEEIAITDGKLGIKAVPVSKITGLNDRLNGIDNRFNDYVTKATYTAEFGTYTSLKNISGKDAHTAIDEINALIDALTWTQL